MTNLTPRNNALTVNPPLNVDEHITTRGSDWYFTVTAIMFASAIAFTIMGARKPQNSRIVIYITNSIVITAGIAYYTMGSDLGYAPIGNEWFRGDADVRGRTRQIFYVRYIDWFITTPLLLLDILLLAALPWSNILFTLFLDIVMIVTGLVGALTTSRFKWGYYTAGCVAFLLIVWQILFVGMRNVAYIGADAKKYYMICAGWLMVLWFLYPIAWGLCEGGNVISSDAEAVFYGVLDVLAKPVFGFLMIFSHEKIGLERIGLSNEKPHGIRHERIGPDGDLIDPASRDGTAAGVTTHA